MDQPPREPQNSLEPVSGTRSSAARRSKRPLPSGLLPDSAACAEARLASDDLFVPVVALLATGIVGVFNYFFLFPFAMTLVGAADLWAFLLALPMVVTGAWVLSRGARRVWRGREPAADRELVESWRAVPADPRWDLCLGVLEHMNRQHPESVYTGTARELLYRLHRLLMNLGAIDVALSLEAEFEADADAGRTEGHLGELLRARASRDDAVERVVDSLRELNLRAATQQSADRHAVLDRAREVVHLVDALDEVEALSKPKRAQRAQLSQRRRRR